MPRVSVIIPTYNRKAYVQEAIDSALAQTFRDLEVIVVDDGSTDGTREALRERYGADSGDRSDGRIVYAWQENQGVSAARNCGIALARGAYVGFLDSDDVWLSEKLEKQVAHLERHPDVGAVFCQGLIMDEGGQPVPGSPVIGQGIRPEDLTLEAQLQMGTLAIAGSTLLVQREVLDRTGGFDPALHLGEDWDFAIRLRAQAPIEQVPEPLCRIRYHLGNQCRMRPWELVEPAMRDHLRVIEKGADLVPAQEPYLSIRVKAEAREYGEAALNAMAWRCYDSATTWLAEAAARDPETWCDPDRLGIILIAYLEEVEERAGALSTQEWARLVRAATAALPAEHYDRRTRRAFYRWMVSFLFFRAAERDDYPMLRWAYPRLLLVEPGRATRLNVVSKGMEAYLGRHLRSLVRGVKRRLGRGGAG